MKNPRSSPFEFAELYAEYGQTLYRFCYRLTGNRTEAEDLTQDVFVVALRDAHRFRGEANVRTWLYQIAIYQARSWRAKRRRERTIRQESASSTDAIETRLAIEAALDSLPPKLKHAFLLVKVEQFTSLEAADILKLPEGTVKFHVYEAIKQLKAFLEDRNAIEGYEIAPTQSDAGVTNAL